MIRGDVALLQVEGLTVRRGTRTVFEDIQLNVDSGDCVILTGENGSGKSTLIESIAGIIPIQSGSVNLAKPFGLTLQSGGINGDELVGERIELAANCGGISDSESLLAEWNLQHRRQDRVCHLSGGLYRRLAVLQGLIPAYGSEKRICILDEPSEGLDENSVRILVEHISALRARGSAFLIATHDQRLHDCATHLFNLEKGVTQTTPNNRPVDVPVKSNTTPTVAFSKWSAKLDQRTMWPILSRGVPFIASCLVLYAMLGNSFDSLILIPAFLASIPPLSSLHHAKDARSGDWWLAMGGRLFAIDPLSVILIGVAPLLTVSFFAVTEQTALGTLDWLMVGFPFIGIYLASGAIHELANKMPRAQAQFIPLLTLVLIWPFLIASDAVEQCLNSGLCEDFSMGIIIATILPITIAFGLPILHPRTASN
tara:strand:- start:2109 stop:3386 length:1278 start_codon:yes stop_codon:yes gene_type:complete